MSIELRLPLFADFDRALPLLAELVKCLESRIKVAFPDKNPHMHCANFMVQLLTSLLQLPCFGGAMQEDAKSHSCGRKVPFLV